MAPARKQKKASAPNAAAVRAAQKKATKAEISAAKSKAWREGHAEELAKIRATIPVAPDAIKKQSGKSNPNVVVERVPGHIGRPAIAYTPVLKDKLFEHIVSGLSLEKISRFDAMPSLPTLLSWVGTSTHPFSLDYARAKALLIPLFEERAIDAATEPQYGELRTVRDDPNGGSVEVKTVDMVERSKLKVAAYQWALGWMMPKKHGRAPDQSGGGANEQLEALFASLKSGPVE